MRWRKQLTFLYQEMQYKSDPIYFHSFCDDKSAVGLCFTSPSEASNFIVSVNHCLNAHMPHNNGYAPSEISPRSKINLKQVVRRASMVHFYILCLTPL